MGQKFAAFDAQGHITAFYDSVDSPAPADVKVVDISDDEWRAALEASTHGMRATLDERRRVVFVEPPAPTRSEVATAKRAERDAALHATDWLVSRHQDEQLLGDGTTLTADQFAVLLRYRQSLREASDLPGWPYTELPSPPLFATAQPKATA
ncbi:tail fiber assembly protein [Burkholderia vietnamiensis]|uniref:Phage tail protein n=2 Tax=Burkholderia vietnamiensis TaxID=60552 RepID=A0ABS1AUI4_BURVI|nr:phage tail assembly chaperone [Burkholderia vietnamiensis]KVG00106.1 phage tail protein [Burkholderia vietnamiensis]KVR78053.1 phage tail protein [Burkholderia vietnamiensis]KVR82665.1 phage tail protein [Burkholderia vietnamiensis]KVR97179.1 phage tail protein [Burkholderia vietnamiensis]KVS43155.1 phage tail protein [Burkholderia vietnamiensis]